MTDKEKTIKELKEALDSLDVTNKYRLNIIRAIEYLQKEPAPKVFEDMFNAKTAAESLGISQEEHDAIVDECLYGKEPELVDVDDLPNKKEEPVSEDLEEAAKEYVTKEGYLAGLHYNSMVRSFKAGAKWQFEKNKQWLADNHKQIFNNGFEEGFEAGRDDMEEQLKKDAITGEWFRCAVVLPSEYNTDDVKIVKITIWQNGV